MAQAAPDNRLRDDAAVAAAAASASRAATPAAPAGMAVPSTIEGAQAAAQPTAGPAAAPPPHPAAAAERVPPRADTPPPARAQAPFPHAEPAAGASPPRREPVRLRWWLLALAALWAIWLMAKPTNRRIEAQMEKAIALAAECKLREAQSELIALRATKATPEQLQQVQKSLNDASAACTRKRLRDKAWREARTAVESAVSAAAFERARARLRAFTRRWGEDDATRAMKQEIDARQPEHPRADEVEGGMTR